MEWRASCYRECVDLCSECASVMCVDIERTAMWLKSSLVLCPHGHFHELVLAAGSEREARKNGQPLQWTGPVKISVFPNMFQQMGVR